MALLLGLLLAVTALWHAVSLPLDSSLTETAPFEREWDAIPGLFTPLVAERAGELKLETMTSSESRQKRRANYDGYHSQHYMEVAPLRHTKKKEGKAPLAIILAASDLIDKRNNRKSKQKNIRPRNKNKKETNDESDHSVNRKNLKHTGRRINDKGKFSVNIPVESVDVGDDRDDRKKVEHQNVEEIDSESLTDRNVSDAGSDQDTAEMTRDLLLDMVKSLSIDKRNDNRDKYNKGNNNKGNNNKENDRKGINSTFPESRVIAIKEHKKENKKLSTTNELHITDEYVNISHENQQSQTNPENNMKSSKNSRQLNKTESPESGLYKTSASQESVLDHIIMSQIPLSTEPQSKHDKLKESTSELQAEVSEPTEHISEDFSHSSASSDESNLLETTRNENISEEKYLQFPSIESLGASVEKKLESLQVEENNEIEISSFANEFEPVRNSKHLEDNPLIIESSSLEDGENNLISRKLVKLIKNKDQIVENYNQPEISFRKYKRPRTSRKHLKISRTAETLSENKAGEEKNNSVIGWEVHSSKLSEEDLAKDKNITDEHEPNKSLSESDSNELVSETVSKNEIKEKTQISQSATDGNKNKIKPNEPLIDKTIHDQPNNKVKILKSDSDKNETKKEQGLLNANDKYKEISQERIENDKKILNRYKQTKNDLISSDLRYTSSGELEESHHGSSKYNFPANLLPINDNTRKHWPKLDSLNELHSNDASFSEEMLPAEHYQNNHIDHYANNNLVLPHDILGVIDSLYDHSESEERDKVCQDNQDKNVDDKHKGSKTYNLSFLFSK